MESFRCQLSGNPFSKATVIMVAGLIIYTERCTYRLDAKDNATDWCHETHKTSDVVLTEQYRSPLPS